MRDGDRTVLTMGNDFQGRYVLRHPWKGDDTCDAARRYRGELARRMEQEAQTLASLTG